MFGSYLLVVCTCCPPEPETPSDRNGDIDRNGWQFEGYMCSLCVNALIRCSIKRNTLIDICSLIGPAETGWQDKRCCASSYCKHVRLNWELIRNTCLCLRCFNPAVHNQYFYCHHCCLYFITAITILLLPSNYCYY